MLFATVRGVVVFSGGVKMANVQKQTCELWQTSIHCGKDEYSPRVNRVGQWLQSLISTDSKNFNTVSLNHSISNKKKSNTQTISCLFNHKIILAFVDIFPIILIWIIYGSLNDHKCICECVVGSSSTAKQMFAFFDVGTNTDTIKEKASNEHLCLACTAQPIPTKWNLANSY